MLVDDQDLSDNSKWCGDKPSRVQGRPGERSCALYIEILQTLCPVDGKALDPFADALTTVFACASTGRACLLLETDERTFHGSWCLSKPVRRLKGLAKAKLANEAAAGEEAAASLLFWSAVRGTALEGSSPSLRGVQWRTVQQTPQQTSSSGTERRTDEETHDEHEAEVSSSPAQQCTSFESAHVSEDRGCNGMSFEFARSTGGDDLTVASGAGDALRDDNSETESFHSFSEVISTGSAKKIKAIPLRDITNIMIRPVTNSQFHSANTMVSQSPSLCRPIGRPPRPLGKKL